MSLLPCTRMFRHVLVLVLSGLLPTLFLPNTSPPVIQAQSQPVVTDSLSDELIADWLTERQAAITISLDPDLGPDATSAVQSPDPRADGVIVKLRDAVIRPQSTHVSLAGQPWLIRARQHTHLLLAVPPGEERTQSHHLLADPNVEYAEPNWSRRSLDMLSEQWYVAKVGAKAAHPVIGGGSSSMIVAVIDTGIDLQHPRLMDRLVPGYNFIGRNNNPDDDEGHGTHVAGIASAMCPGCSLMPVKVINSAGSAWDYDVASGIRYAAEHGARVINLSLGGFGRGEFLCEAIAYAQGKGALVVAAAGNSGRDEEVFPADCNPAVVKVGATGANDELAWYSNFGNSVDLVAPGGNPPLKQEGDALDWITSTCLDGSYCRGAGTSMAAPAVAGGAALLWSHHPSATASQIASNLTSTADDLGVPGRDARYGWGRLNLARAVGLDGHPWISEPTANTIWLNAPGGTVQISAYMRDDQQVISRMVAVPALGITAAMAGTDHATGSLRLPANTRSLTDVYTTTLQVQDNRGQQTVVKGPTIYVGSPAWDTSAWPMDQRNPQHTGKADDDIEPRPKFAWGERIAGSYVRGFCSRGGHLLLCGDAVVVIGGACPIPGGGGIFHAINAATGKVAWELNCAKGDAIPAWTGDATPVFHKGRIVIRGCCGIITVATAEHGTILWQKDVGVTISASPVIDNGILYIPVADDGVVALDFETGNQLWRFPLGSNNTRSIEASPAVAQGKVFVAVGCNGCSGYLLALDAKTGREVWRSAGLLASQYYIAPTYWQGSLYLSNGGQRVYRLDAATGRVIWMREVKAPIRRSSPAITAEGLIVFGMSDEWRATTASVIAFDVNGNLRWRSFLAMYEEPTSPITIGKYIVVGDGYRLKLLRSSTGQIVWASQAVDISGKTTPVWDGKRLFWGTSEGYTWAYAIPSLRKIYLPLVQR